jgi:hypothetical protein
LTDAVEKLEADVAVVEFMVSKMAGYLASHNLFGPTNGKMPKTTLGGYLMRQQRLRGVGEGVLPTAVFDRFRLADSQFEQILSQNIVRTEQKGAEEFAARLRQWEAYIRDLRQDAKTHGVYYATAVEPRAMLAALQQRLTQPPYQFETRLNERLTLLDSGLRGIWEPGDFVWPAAWAQAYPASDYWWLYGRPIVE